MWINHSQVSIRIPNPSHTITACDRITSQSLYKQDFSLIYVNVESDVDTSKSSVLLA